MLDHRSKKHLLYPGIDFLCTGTKEDALPPKTDIGGISNRIVSADAEMYHKRFTRFSSGGNFHPSALNAQFLL
jgi:hypothetical protein